MTFPFSFLLTTKHTILIIALSALTISSVLAQTPKSAKGVLQDSTGLSIISATIKLISPSDTLHAASDIDGNFSFDKIKADHFTLQISSLGFENFTKTYRFETKKNALDIGKIIMKTDSKVLQEVRVEGSPLIVVKEDTLEYRAKDYNMKPNAVTEDLIKKLDGVQVDKDGNITAQGEAITRVRINGKDFFGGDVKTATKNLPADIIERIQIIDDYGDQANLTGNRTGEPERILNFMISPDKNKGDFGTFRAGGGTEDRYQATASYNSFSEGRQFSALGNLNNTNAPLFDFQTRGGGARRGPGGGGGGMMRGGGGIGGGSNGLTNVGSIGLNYRKSFMDEKLTTYGNYSYGHTDTRTLTDAIIQYPYLDNPTVNTQMRNQKNISNNHRFDWNIEYKPNDKDYFKLSPTFAINNTDNTGINEETFKINDILNSDVFRKNGDISKSPEIGISGLYNHKINDKGRNIFMNFSLNNSKTDQDRDELTNTFVYENEDEDFYLRQLIDLNNKRLNGGVSLSYTEPINDKSGLELAYDYNFANYDNNRLAFNVDDDGLTTPDPLNSNIYDYSFNTNRFSLTYRYRTDKINYSLGASAQPSLLKGNTVLNGEQISFKRNETNFAPVARFEYKFSRTKGINFSYNGRSNEPSFSQLQPITDISNPQFPTTGNPKLNAEFSHNIRLRYNNFNTETGMTFFAFLNGTKTDNKIVTNRIQSLSDQYGLVQATSYLNTDGFYSTMGFYNISKAFNKRKYVISANGSANFNNNVSFLNSEKNTAKNLVLSQGLNIQVNLGEWLEVNPGIRYSFNTTKNTVQDRLSRDINTWSYDLNSKLYITPSLLWGAELSKTTNTGYENSIDANPFIINTYIEKQFLKDKSGAIRLHAYDLLDEQVSISRSVTESSISDTRTNRLARYFMLSFTYKFQKFGGVSAAPERSQEWRGRGEGGRPMH